MKRTSICSFVSERGLTILFRKALAIAACVLMLAFVFAGCSKKTDDSADNSLANITTKGQLNMGVDDAFPPMGFRSESNEIVGFDIDMAREVCSRMGVELNLVPIDWTAKENILDSGRIDCIWNGYTMTDKRKERVLFTKPYLDNAQVIMVLTGSDIAAKSDLAGKIVGLQEDSSAEDAVAADDINTALAELKKYPENNSCLLDLQAKRIDAMVVDEVVARYYMAKATGTYVLLADDLGTEEYGIGFRKTEAALRDKVQETLDAMKADGKSAEISTVWFGEDMVK